MGGDGGGWLEKLRIRLVSWIPTKLKLKLSLSLETTFFLVRVSCRVGGVGGWLEKMEIKLSHLKS